jgi:hypothetical protein
VAAAHVAAGAVSEHDPEAAEVVRAGARDLAAWTGSQRASRPFIADAMATIERCETTGPAFIDGPSSADEPADRCPTGYVLAGLADGRAMGGAFALTPESCDGFTPRIDIVEESPAAAAFGLAAGLLLGAFDTQDLQSTRLGWFLGPGASDRFARALTQRTAYALPAGVLTSDPSHGELGDACSAALGVARDAQARRHTELLQAVRARGAARSGTYWQERYRDAAPPDANDPNKAEAEPLRVLVASTRYSTFVASSAADIAQGFRAAGCEAELLIEPTPHDKLVTVSYLETLDRFDPDLLIFINYARAQLGDAAPPVCPSVCWIQDAMEHLFDPALGAAQGPMDFLVGHVYRELFDKHGWDPRRAMQSVVLASEAKFRPVDDCEVTRQERDRFACEIALVSNHGQTPDELAQHIKPHFGGGPAGELIDKVLATIPGVLAEQSRVPEAIRLREQTDRIVASFGGDARTAATVFRQATMPLAERTARHEAAGAAKSIAERRGWRFHIYGRGWEGGAFAAHARGALNHGEELRLAYAFAAISLHASVSGALHQRVLECALSGGLTACRRTAETVKLLANGLHARAGERLAHAEPARTDERGTPLHHLADSWECMLARRQAQLLGPPWADDTVGDAFAGLVPFIKRPRSVLKELALDTDTLLLLGDLDQITFDTERQLEAIVERAVQRPAWRASMSEGTRRRALRSLTYRGAAQRVLSMVGSSLANAAEPVTARAPE